MRPVAIFRFSASEGPGFFAEWLEGRGIPYEVIAIDGGAPVPPDLRAYSGVGMMGGPMSVNDPLAWISPLCEFLRHAVDAKVPVVGHCLGGQLLSYALGGTVTRAEKPEIGWIDVDVDEAAAGQWFGGQARFTSFQWHYDTFTLPPGAQRLLHNKFIPNQAFVFDDRHIGLQCHVEMTDELVRTWCATGSAELPLGSTPNVQSAADIQRDLRTRVGALQEIASSLYSRWARALGGAG